MFWNVRNARNVQQLYQHIEQFLGRKPIFVTTDPRTQETDQLVQTAIEATISAIEWNGSPNTTEQTSTT